MQEYLVYNAIAEILGATRVTDRENVAGTKGPEGNTFLIGTPSCGRGDRREWYTSGFAVPNRAAVDVAHANAIELGGNCEGPRGPKEMNYYAAYFRDPDGNKIMVARQGPD